MGRRIGSMRERVTLQRRDAQTFDLTSLTRSGTTATATVNRAHGYATGDYVTIAGADQAYNGTAKITVTSTTVFTFTCTAGLTSPATGAVTVTYVSDAQGGRRSVWRDVDTVSAELVPISTSERVSLGAVQSDVAYRFRVRSRTDLDAAMTMRWTPSWPPHCAEQLLEIRGILPQEDGRVFSLIDCATSPA